MNWLEIAQMFGLFGVAPTALYTGIQKAIEVKVNGKIDRLESEMCNRLDRIDFRLTDVESDLSRVQTTVDNIRDGRIEVGERLGRLEAEDS